MAYDDMPAFIDPQGPVMRAVYEDVALAGMVRILQDACDRGLTVDEVSKIVRSTCDAYGEDVGIANVREALDRAVDAKRPA